MLRLYCRALTERGVEVQDLEQLVEKNIGWSRSDVATSDGAAIFLPGVVERFEAEADNFEFLKVMLTQQAGHIEFGSFEFEFDRPATRFADLRPKLRAAPHHHDHDHGHEEHHDPPGATELTRLFKLFPNKRLALDIFSIAEGARLEARIMREYPGMAAAYRKLRRRNLQLRPELTLLPARETLLESMIRLSLGQTRGVKVPREHANLATRLRDMLRSLGEPGATVEDAAEATIRIYARLAKVKNDYLQPKDFMILEDSERAGRSKGPRGLDRSGSAAKSRPEFDDDWGRDLISLPTLVGREREYLSPQGVDYRGDFHPELAQLLTQVQANARAALAELIGSIESRSFPFNS